MNRSLLARTHTSGMRKCQKTPIYMVKETYAYDKRDLFIWQKRPVCVCVCVCVCVFVCNTYMYISHLSLRSLTDSSCSSADLFVYVIMYVYVLMCVCARYYYRSSKWGPASTWPPKGGEEGARGSPFILGG